MTALASALTAATVLALWRGPRRRPWRSSARRPAAHPPGERPPVRSLVALLTLAVGIGVSPVAGAIGVVAVAIGRRWHSRAEARRQVRTIERALPDVIDLFLIAARAGHPVAPAIVQIAPRAPPPVRSAMLRAAEQLRRGLPLAEVLGHLQVALGPRAEQVTSVLRQAAVTGASLADLLDPIARAAADHRRRSAQEAARRLPVTLLVPLAACILPAAVLLAVVPVVLVSVASLAS